MNDNRGFNEESRARWDNRMEQNSGQSHVWTGLFFLVIGGIALAKSFGVPVPRWLFSWQMLLIAIGLFIGIRKGFREGGWFVPIIIGAAFLANDYIIQGDLRRHIWPVILIVLGVLFILRPRKSGWACTGSHKRTGGQELPPRPATAAPFSDINFSDDDVVDATAIFGGTKKVILSKAFKGGEIVNIFGGSEIDLTQADINGTAVLELTAIFGGATLVVPSHWIVKSEAVSIFGGISDKRKNFLPITEGPTKALVIKGTVLFGGIEIKSY